MVHNTNKKALYEVIGRAGSKSGYEKLHPGGTAGETPSINPLPSPNVVRWERKPSVIQFNAGRVEFSVPYQVAIAIALGMLLAVVVMFRLGQRVSNRDVSVNAPVVTKPVVSKPAESKLAMSKQDTPVVRQQAEQEAPVVQSASTGRNRIVLKIFQVRSHLEPAKEYFDKLGVATEIIEKDNMYYLVTKNKYNGDPKKAGTDGYQALQKIIELGAGYKAPPGLETFGPKPFSDAFGMRFDD